MTVASLKFFKIKEARLQGGTVGDGGRLAVAESKSGRHRIRKCSL